MSQAPHCAQCGHAIGDHNHGRRTLAGALMGSRWPGVCLIAACDCRQFIPEQEGLDQLQGAVDALTEIHRQTPRLPATDPVTGEPSPWTIAADYFADFGGR